jgi:hypothetical protein
LDTQKSDLGLVGIDPVLKIDTWSTVSKSSDGFGFFGALSTKLSDSLHHGLFKLSKPKLDFIFTLDSFYKSNGFFSTSKILGDTDDLKDLGATFFGLVVLELDGVNSIEQLVTEEFSDSSWVGTLRQNDQKHLLGDEEESREIQSLDLQIVFKRSLTVLKMFLKLWEETLEHIHGTTLDNLLGVRSFLHNSQPSLIDGLELLSFKRHFLGNIT